MTWFDERLGESLAWSHYTKNTFIEFDEQEEERAGLRRERSAPASAVTGWDSLQHTAIEEAATWRLERDAAAAAMHWAMCRPAIGRSRGRSIRRTPVHREGQSRGGSSSCSRQSSGKSSRWSSGQSSGRSRRCRVQPKAGWSSRHVPVERMCAGMTSQRGTPARLPAQHLSSASSESGSYAGASSRLPGTISVERVNAGVTSHRGTPARLPSQSLSRTPSEDSFHAGTPPTPQLPTAMPTGAEGLGVGVGHPESGMRSVKSIELTTSRCSGDCIGDQPKALPGDALQAIVMHEGSGASLSSSSWRAAPYSVTVSNRFTALQVEGHMRPCDDGLGLDSKLAEVQEDLVVSAANADEAVATEPSPKVAGPAVSDCEHAQHVSSGTGQQAAHVLHAASKRRRRRGARASAKPGRSCAAGQPQEEIQPRQEEREEGLPSQLEARGLGAADVLRHLEGLLLEGLAESSEKEELAASSAGPPETPAQVHRSLAHDVPDGSHVVDDAAQHEESCEDSTSVRRKDASLGEVQQHTAKSQREGYEAATSARAGSSLRGEGSVGPAQDPSAPAPDDTPGDDPGVRRLAAAQADSLALFTARLNEPAIASYLRSAASRRQVLAVPVDPCTGEAPDVLQLHLGSLVVCEAVDASGWGFGAVLVPRTQAGKRGCFRCEGMRPLAAQLHQLRSGEQLELTLGTWEEVEMSSRSTSAQQRLRNKALIKRIHAARAAWLERGFAR